MDLDEVVKVAGYDDMSNVYLLLELLPPGERCKAHFDAIRRANELVSRYWCAIDALADELHAHGVLDGDYV